MRKVIKLTDEQLMELKPFFYALESKGSIAAQIYHDGIHVVLLSPAKAMALNIGLAMVINDKDMTTNSAEAAYQDGLKRDAEKT